MRYLYSFGTTHPRWCGHLWPAPNIYDNFVDDGSADVHCSSMLWMFKRLTIHSMTMVFVQMSRNILKWINALQWWLNHRGSDSHALSYLIFVISFTQAVFSIPNFTPDNWLKSPKNTRISCTRISCTRIRENLALISQLCGPAWSMRVCFTLDDDEHYTTMSFLCRLQQSTFIKISLQIGLNKPCTGPL